MGHPLTNKEHWQICFCIYLCFGANNFEITLPKFQDNEK